METISYLVRNGYVTPVIAKSETKFELTDKGNEFYKKYPNWDTRKNIY